MGATEFWKGDFGRAYTERNRVDVQTRVPFWRRMLELTQARSILEVGCNAGWNLLAMKAIDKDLDLVGVDLNAHALEQAENAGIQNVHLMHGADVGDCWPLGFDLVFTAGVLIHVPTENLGAVMRSIVDASRRYVLAVEYAANVEEAIEYRGHKDRLWRRPFGVLYEDAGLRLLETGILSQRDGFDSCTYWLMERP